MTQHDDDFDDDDEALEKATPESLRLAARLREALDGAAEAEANSLAWGIAVGHWVHEAKAYLTASPTTILQSWTQWFRQHCKGRSIRSANRYEMVYIQVSACPDRQPAYQSMDEVLRDYRKAHPARPRFVPDTAEKASKAMALKEEALAAARVEVRDEVQAMAREVADFKARAEAKRRAKEERRDLLLSAPPGPPEEFEEESPGAGLLRLSEIIKPGPEVVALEAAYQSLEQAARDVALKELVQSHQGCRDLIGALGTIMGYWMAVGGCDPGQVQDCAFRVATILHPDDDDDDDDDQPTPPDPTPSPPQTSRARLRHRITEGDCFEVLGSLRRSHAGQVQLGLTSSPYPGRFEDHYPGVSADEFPAYTLRWLALVQPLLTPTGCVALNVGTQIKDFHVQPWIHRLGVALNEAGWYERYNPIWIKPDAAPLGAKELPRRSWEYVLVLTRDPRSCYLDPYGNGRPSGRIGPVNGPAWSWSKQGSTDGCHEGMARGTDLFRVGVAANAENDLGKGHPARFPAQLAQEVIRVLSRPNDIVLDPFAGTGSTAVAAIREGRRSLGIEIMPEYAGMARAWIARELVKSTAAGA